MDKKEFDIIKEIKSFAKITYALFGHFLIPTWQYTIVGLIILTIDDEFKIIDNLEIGLHEKTLIQNETQIE